ncbi:MAG: hypothetical protein JNL94_09315 [Planctomycetes bacterium]|nr:hypothetical protein [Planctomycetota bacterium]
MTIGMRCAFGIVAVVALAAVLGVDGNPRGPAAIAAILADQGADVEARTGMARAERGLARFGTTIVDGRLRSLGSTPDAVVRSLKFAVRDDAARAWWAKRSAVGPIRDVDEISRTGGDSR